MRGRFNDLGLYYAFKFELVPREKDGNRSDDYLKDAFLGWDAFNVFDIRLGRMKVPLSRANMKSTKDRFFPYAPALNALVPKRQLGLSVALSDPYSIVTLRGGVFNSVRKAMEQMKDLKQLLYVGRLEFNLHQLIDVTAPDVDLATLNLSLQVAGSAGWIEESYDPRTEHRWLGVDAALTLWRFTAEFEWAIKEFYQPEVFQAGVGGVEVADRGWGWHVDLIAELWPDTLEVMGRYERSDGDQLIRGFDPNLSMDELSRRKKEWITAGLKVRFLSRAACMLTYTYRNELEGLAIKDDVLMTTCQYAM